MTLFNTFAWLDGAAFAGQLQRLGLVVLHSAWLTTAVAAALAVLLRVLPRRSAAAAQARYAVSMLALVSLPVACIISSCVVEVPRRIAAPTVDLQPETFAGFSWTSAAVTPEANGRAGVVPLATATLQAAAEAAHSWLAWCGAFWVVGVAAAVARLAGGWSAARRLVAMSAVPADARWQARLDRWSHVLRIPGRIRLLVSPHIDVPMVVGWLQPVVIWPLAAVSGMSPDQVDAILVHELAHVRRHDVLVNLVQCCVEVIFFHHPAAWWISAQVRAEREHCADDLAIRALQECRAGSRLSYARALIALEERRQSPALAIAAAGGSLTSRIERIAGVEPAGGHPARLAAAVLALVTVGTTAAAIAAATPREASTVVEVAVTTDPVPADTSTAGALTPEQAGALVPGGDGQLPLDGLATLDVATADVLVARGGFRLSLNGLEQVSPDVARSLARFKGRELSLGGLKAISTETALAISGFKGHNLRLVGLQSLDAEAAKGIARFSGPHLFLNGLTAVDAATAAELAAFQGDGLFLAGLTTLPADAAAQLAKFKGGQLDLNGLTTISPDAARVLAGYKGNYLHLEGLATLDRKAARELTQFRGQLDLKGLTTLSVDVAEALAETRSPRLSLGGLTAISPEAARALGRCRGTTLSLNGMASLTAEAARGIAAFGASGSTLQLCGLKTLSADVAGAIAEFRGARLDLNGIEALDADAARLVAGFGGKCLNLGGVATLDAAAATKVAEFNGELLNLASLRAESPAVVEAVTSFKGTLWLNGLLAAVGRKTPLTPDMARAISRGAAKVGPVSLPGVTGFETRDAVEIATLLASCAVPVSLPNLRKISPKTLAALFEKKDVEIPPIEMLELIPEPDGSESDDFVIPDDFEARRRQSRSGR